ncbi:sugar transferase [Phaeobacter italicus]|uniref:sugar transferase n=1 Tax=Phaeobacter italicus TaxID=481446 RepID=UPI00242A38F3|nr:sugar transferase [Phaeobacter italicus]MCI5101121.1 sugar transferase [Phaeobacter italicus]
MKDFVHDGAVHPPLRSGRTMMLPRSRMFYAGRPFQRVEQPRLIANLNTAISRQPSQIVDWAQRDRPAWSYGRFGKRVLDILLVLIALPITLPLILLAALALWFEGGQPFYTQDRLGQRGRVFSILKLRTMVRNADQLLEEHLARDPEMRREWNETQKLKHDPRITPVGRFLRTTSLDELPQLWNVIIGEMSLVGPRPMLPDQLPLYGDARPYFLLKPGITGLWQVSVRNEGGFAVRAGSDASYCRTLSFLQDLAILWRTVGVVLRGTGY